MCVYVLTQQGVGFHHDQVADTLVVNDTLPLCDLPSKISACITDFPVVALFVSVPVYGGKISVIVWVQSKLVLR